VLALTSDGQLWYGSDPDRILISGRNMPVNQLRALFDEGKLKDMQRLFWN
jgi:hypothetical protein